MELVAEVPKVRLVWITPDAEKTIAYCARVSNPANQDNENISGLLAYCARKEHWSIFEMASACVEITTTRAIARQILRHRSFSFQEFSQRYAKAEQFAYAAARRQDDKNRQNSIDDLGDKDVEWWFQAQDQLIESASTLYDYALHKGIAKECARAVLPEGMMLTRMYMSGTIRSWLTYLRVRLGNGTQLEHRNVANLVFLTLRPELTNVMAAFNDFDEVRTS